MTIDADLNVTAYKALNGRKGTVAVFNYETGEILCMVSTPTYDPANPPTIQDGDTNYEGVYLNRFLSSNFVPGSIFKLVTLAAAIENISDLYDRSFTCSGSMTVGDSTVTCTSSHGTQKIEDALANSCNCAFAEIALELGSDTIIKYAENYGLLDTQKIDGITTGKGTLDSAADGSPELAWLGIGQYTDTINPASFLRFVGAIANGGKAVEMKLIKNDGLFSSTDTEQLIKPGTATKLASMMNYNVYSKYGTGNFPGLEISAKSGTAEVGSGDPHAWFTGFIENEDHPLAFIVLVENGGWGSSVAGSVANTVLQAAIN
jgi:peptidoglycan glycosyltransferase